MSMVDGPPLARGFGVWGSCAESGGLRLALLRRALQVQAAEDVKSESAQTIALSISVRKRACNSYFL
jgi:hypothetical protein